MALPKRQHSKQRGRKRRTHQGMRVPNLSTCPKCKKPVIPHRVCPFCGHYKGLSVVRIEEPKKDKKKQ